MGWYESVVASDTMSLLDDCTPYFSRVILKAIKDNAELVPSIINASVNPNGPAKLMKHYPKWAEESGFNKKIGWFYEKSASKVPDYKYITEGLVKLLKLAPNQTIYIKDVAFKNPNNITGLDVLPMYVKKVLGKTFKAIRGIQACYPCNPTDNNLSGALVPIRSFRVVYLYEVEVYESNPKEPEFFYVNHFQMSQYFSEQAPELVGNPFINILCEVVTNRVNADGSVTQIVEPKSITYAQGDPSETPERKKFFEPMFKDFVNDGALRPSPDGFTCIPLRGDNKAIDEKTEWEDLHKQAVTAGKKCFGTRKIIPEILKGLKDSPDVSKMDYATLVAGFPVNTPSKVAHNYAEKFLKQAALSNVPLSYFMGMNNKDFLWKIKIHLGGVSSIPFNIDYQNKNGGQNKMYWIRPTIAAIPIKYRVVGPFATRVDEFKTISSKNDIRFTYSWASCNSETDNIPSGFSSLGLIFRTFMSRIYPLFPELYDTLTAEEKSRPVFKNGINTAYDNLQRTYGTAIEYFKNPAIVEQVHLMQRYCSQWDDGLDKTWCWYYGPGNPHYDKVETPPENYKPETFGFFKKSLPTAQYASFTTLTDLHYVNYSLDNKLTSIPGVAGFPTEEPRHFCPKVVAQLQKELKVAYDFIVQGFIVDSEIFPTFGEVSYCINTAIKKFDEQIKEQEEKEERERYYIVDPIFVMEKTKNTFLPIDREILARCSFGSQNDIATCSKNIAFNLVEWIYHPKKKWYQKGIFQVITMVIAALLATVTNGTSLVIAMGNIIATQILVLVLTPMLSAVFGNSFGTILVQVIATIVTQGAGAVNSFSSALLEVVTSPSFWINTISAVIGHITEGIAAAISDVMKKLNTLTEEFNKKSEEIGNAFKKLEKSNSGLIAIWASPSEFLAYNDFYIAEDRDTFLRRTLATGSEIAENNLNRLHNFVEDQLDIQNLRI